MIIHRHDPRFLRARIIELVQIRETQLRRLQHQRDWLSLLYEALNDDQTDVA